MDTFLIISPAILLSVFAFFLNFSNLKWRYISIVPLIGLTMFIVLFLAKWLQEWFSDRVYYVVNWLSVGILIGVVTLFLRINNWLAILIALIIPMALQYGLNSSSSHDIAFGWGWYALPLSVAAVIFIRSLNQTYKDRAIYTGCWLFVITATIFPLYMRELDHLATMDPRSYPSVLQGLLLPKAVELNILYLLGTLFLLFLPGLLKMMRLGRFSLSAIFRTSTTH